MTSLKPSSQDFSVVIRPTRSARRLSAPGIAALSALHLPFAWPAAAHDAPTGWSYPFTCCSDYDCRPVQGKAISAKPEGYVINGTGEVLAYSDTRVRHSPDGEYHWCSVAGANDGRTICLFVPPQSY